MTRDLSFAKESHSHWAINTTVRCQHRCVYCFEGKRSGLDDMTPEQTEQLLAQAVSKVPAVIFMGAEPTLNPHLPRLLACARGLGLRADISTNALRLSDADYLRKLHEAGLGTIELSFPYPDDQVYERVSRARPRGFFRLLLALENIDRLNRSIAQVEAHWINVNVVVSRFNVDRLDEVVRHVTSRLSLGTFGFTFKHLLRPDTYDTRAFLEEVYVPVGQLREGFTQLAPLLDGRHWFCFRGFPLCALPQLERFDGDLGYQLSSVVVAHNFQDQGHFQDMYAQAALGRSHPFEWVCEACSLEPICLHRWLFEYAADLSDHAPIPVAGAMPSSLAEWVSRHDRAEPMLRRSTVRTALGEMLAALLRAVPLGSTIPGTAVRMAPLRSGVVQLSSGDWVGKLRIGPESTSWAPAWRAGHHAMAVCDDSAPLTWESPGVKALAKVLEALPPPAVADAVLEVQDKSPLAHLVCEVPVAPEAVCYDREQWEEFLGAVFLPRFADEVRRSGLRTVQVEGVTGLGVTLRRDGSDTGHWIGVTPRSGPKTRGVLCGRVRLVGDPAKVGDTSPWLPALSSATEAIEAAGAWPRWLPGSDGSFLARVWGVFGKALLPRAGPAGSLVTGWVGDTEVRLAFVAAGDVPFEILLAPADLLRSPHATGHGIGLQFHISKAVADRPGWMGIVDGYAAGLVARARSRTERSRVR